MARIVLPKPLFDTILAYFTEVGCHIGFQSSYAASFLSLCATSATEHNPRSSMFAWNRVLELDDVSMETAVLDDIFIDDLAYLKR